MNHSMLLKHFSLLFLLPAICSWNICQTTKYFRCNFGERQSIWPQLVSFFGRLCALSLVLNRGWLYRASTKGPARQTEKDIWSPSLKANGRQLHLPRGHLNQISSCPHGWHISSVSSTGDIAPCSWQLTLGTWSQYSNGLFCSKWGSQRLQKDMIYLLIWFCWNQSGNNGINLS